MGSQGRIRLSRFSRLPPCLEGMLPFLLLDRGRDSDVIRGNR